MIPRHAFQSITYNGLKNFVLFLVCLRNSGPLNLLVSALKKELRHGEESQAGRNHCEAAAKLKFA